MSEKIEGILRHTCADGALPVLTADSEHSAHRWTLAPAVDLCRLIEAICPEFGCHVALTGGCLYKDGERKDLDILFYRIRQVEEIDKDGLFEALRAIGVEHVKGFGWCHKATFNGLPIDCFFPEEDGDYPVNRETYADVL